MEWRFRSLLYLNDVCFSAMLQMLSAGRKHQPAGYRNAITTYPQFMFLAVREGELHVAENGRRAKVLRPTSFLLLTPGISVDLSSPRSGYRGFYVEGFPEECTVSRGVHRLDDDAELRRLCAAIEQELDAAAADGLATLLLHELFLRALRGLNTAGDPVAQIERRLEHHCYGAHQLDDVLDGLAWSRRQLERRFLAATGNTIKERHLALRLSEACRLLTVGMSVTDIALDLGFPSSQYFATAFRRHYHQSPSHWRTANT